MSQSTQDVSTLDGRLAGIDRRLREIQAELVPERAPHDAAGREPVREPRSSGSVAEPVSRDPAPEPRSRGPATEPRSRGHAPEPVSREPAGEPPAREPRPRGRTGPLAAALSRPARRAGDADRLDQIGELTAVYADLLVSLREVLERHQPPASALGGGERVTVSTGPFSTIGAVRAFEQRLATLPGVDDVHLRGYEGDDRAVFDVRLGGDSS